ncbi:WD40 repeat [Streptomyces sp. OV198]|uniref:nSTAND1 domain-containing NTPase n=1 Tax=Streptomyces sp. OV198 TaxID=1882787 RepID=UPI000BD12664|nr:WD40 repeat [Streptomyces sp. OV198]
MAGRPESPLDPSEGPAAGFAAELRQLRAAAGSPSYRVMAQRTGQGASTLSQAAAGERLPTLTVVLAYVKACDGDVAEWEERWRRAAEEAAATGDRDDDAAAPYRGLARFEPGDRDLFFGRDALVDQLAAHMRTHRLVAVVGASGSGKSSLLRAGLIPALQTPAAPDRRLAALRILTPGPHPLATHAGAVTPREAAEGDTVVVVDQLEELYTLCQDPVERSAFVDLLMTAVRPDSRLRVVIAVRADFFGRCAEHHLLAEALRQATLLVGPMSPAELREAIVKPAAVAGLIVERELTAQIIDDVADEPGGLPLLSHALLETWRRRKGRALTVEMYEATGGIHGAIAKSAEQVYSTFSDAEAEAARRILLRLITPGDGVPDTRRPTNSAELDNGSPEARHVLSQLVRTRLLTLDGDIVDLAHEALITAWPRYRAWIEEDRERLRLHRKLTEAAQTWDELNRDPGALYRGSRLAAVLDVFGPARHPDLTGVEDAFLTASIAARDDDEKAAARTTRRLRSLTAALSVLLVLALAASVTAWIQSRVSEQQRQAADAARQVALSRQLAAQSTGLMGTDPDLGSLLAVQAYRTSPTTEATTSLYTAATSPLTRRLTGHSAWVPSLAFSPDGRILATASDDHTVRLWDAATGRTRNILVGHQASVASLAFSPDGHILATASDDRTVRLWDVATGHPMRRWDTAGSGPGERGTNGHPDSMVSVVFSPDGHTLATTSDGRTVSLREVATGRTRPILTAPDVTASVAFSPDGRTVVTTNEQGTVRLWDVATGQLRSTFPEINDGGGPVAFSPDAHTFAIGSSVDGTVGLRDVATGHSRATLTGHTDSVRAVAFSPDGRVVATASDDRTVRLWDAATGRTRLILPGRTDWMVSLAFSPDGNTLATGSYDGTVRLWDVGTRRPRVTLGHTGIVMSTAFSPDGHTLATGGYDGTVHLWDAATGRSRVAFANHDDAALVAFSPDGHTLATASGQGTLRRWGVATGHAQTLRVGREGVTTSVGFSPDGRTLVTADLSQDRPSKSWQLSEIVRLWDVATGRPRTSLSLADGAATVAFSPDGHTLAISGHDGTVRIWDMTTRRARTVPTGGSAGALAYSPDGSTLATASSGNTVKLWNTATSQLQTTLTGHQDTVTSVAFSSDGHTLATGSNDGTVRLWNTATGQTQASLTTPTSVGPVTFSPDGHTLATTSANPDHSGDTVRLWDIATLDQSGAIKKICRAVDRDLTVRERSVYLPGQLSTPVCPP